ncbi:MAG: hypothetical protein JSV36_13435 [Anaerolineae bacterium]|nr:MAG: hypothetical protein JSV36_13435 [Anaerolineae bacterium]
MHSHQREVLLLEWHRARLRVGQEHIRAGGEKQDPNECAQTPALAADGREIDQHKYGGERCGQ